MDIVAEIIKVLMIPIVLLAIPIIFVLIFDIAAHLGELFGER